MENKDETTMFGGQGGDKRLIGKDMKVLIIGEPSIGKTSIINRIENTNEDIIVLDSNDLKDDSSIDALVKRQTNIYKEQLDRIAHELNPYSGNNYTRKLSSDINILKEYELIKQKKSKLSKWERDEIVRIVENKK